ncbi:MAG: hypothetical protein L6R37_008407, partial [Teloschistes peruensis]
MRKDKNGTMAEFMRDEEVLAHDIIAVQEPWCNPFQATTHHPEKGRHHLIWPSENIPKESGINPVRVCLFVNTRIDPASVQVFNYPDVGTLQTILIKHRQDGTTKKIAIHNVYLASGEARAEEVTSAKDTIQQLREAPEHHRSHDQIVLGDFISTPTIKTGPLDGAGVILT